MPRVQQHSTPTANLSNGRLEQELFHLERTIARGELWQRDITDSLDDVVESNDDLKKSVDALTEMMAGAYRLMRKLLEGKDNA